MSATGFHETIKESNLIIKQHDGTQRMLTCTILEFIDKIIIQLAMDGETDISYDIQIPEHNDLKKPPQAQYTELEEGEVGFDEDHQIALESTIVPTVLIGAGNNMKTQVLASQVGHVMAQHSNKNLILNISGILFGNPLKAEEYHPNDSIVVQQVIHIVTDTYLHGGQI
jgi:hypothetical protein